MNITRAQLSAQYGRVLRLGWLPFFEEAAQITAECFDTADLLGIASRESNLDPKWLKHAGDHGNGFGLMQADARSFPDWIRTGKWKDAREGILMGARVLMGKWLDVESAAGKRVTVRSSKDNRAYRFIAKHVTGAEAQAVTIASYNAGRWAHYAVSKGQSPDTYTTGKDYSSDVIARAAVFRELMAKEKKETETLPSTTPLTLAAAAASPTDNDAFLADAFDKNVSPDQLKDAGRSAGQKAWQFLVRPLGLFYAALEAGNIAAWFGIAVVVIAVALMIYWHRADIAKVFDKLKGKLTAS